MALMVLAHVLLRLARAIDLERTVHHVPFGSYGDGEHGRRCEDISCARTVPARNHHSVCVRRRALEGEPAFALKSRRGSSVGRSTSGCRHASALSVLAGLAIVVTAFIKLA